MKGLEDMQLVPDVEDMAEEIHNDLFMTFYHKMQMTYQVRAVMEFSKCSWEHGWNLKLKKAGRTLCTVYPRDGYMGVMVVIGKKEKPLVEACLSQLTKVVADSYRDCQEGNDQRWLLIELEDEGSVYMDVLKLIDIRYQCR